MRMRPGRSTTKRREVSPGGDATNTEKSYPESIGMSTGLAVRMTTVVTESWQPDTSARAAAARTVNFTRQS